MPEETVVIVGAGHGGIQVAARLTELHWPGRIVIVDREAGETYERPPLSKDFLKAGEPVTTPLRKEHFFSDKNIERVTGELVAIDREAQELKCADGSSLSYTKLVLAPGSLARPLTVPGGDLPGVHLLKSKDDALALRGALKPNARVVVVGAGYIGLEVAAAAVALGCQVTVLEFMDRVMSRVTSEPVSAYFQHLHERNGVRFVFGAAVTELRGDDHVNEVVTADGASYAADVVIAGIGVIPNQQIAEDAGIAVRDGILVDADSRTSDPNVYAAGDATRYVNESEGIDRRLESIQSAQVQGIHAANHIAGAEPHKPEVPWFWTIQHGVRLQTAGLRQPDDDVVIRGDQESGQFTVLYLRDGHLAALDTIGSLSDFTAGKKLIASQVRLDVAAARDRSNKLSATAVDAVAQSA